MSRSNDERLEDILSAIARIDQIWATHNDRATVIDACLFHLVVIGEAVNRIDADLLDREPDIPWAGIVGPATSSPTSTTASTTPRSPGSSPRGSTHFETRFNGYRIRRADREQAADPSRWAVGRRRRSGARSGSYAGTCRKTSTSRARSGSYAGTCRKTCKG